MAAAGRDRFFDDETYVPSTESGRTVVLDGGKVDTLLGFYCAMGEAVNGPGGYFGRSIQGFDDCLFTGFGLEYPYTIVWRNAAASRAALDSAALLGFLADECNLLQPARVPRAALQRWAGLVYRGAGGGADWRPHPVR